MPTRCGCERSDDAGHYEGGGVPNVTSIRVVAGREYHNGRSVPALT